ncbi:hypothetical protein CRYUN_Cryun40dG0070000 [Craigia yunnanensis]
MQVAEKLSSGALAWSQRKLYMLHCLGVLLNCQINDPCMNIRDKVALVSNLLAGLQLPSDEIRGEVLFVLYKLSIHAYASKDCVGADVLQAFCPSLLRLSMEALLKTQRDDVRLNGVAFLTLLAQIGLFGNGHGNEISSVSSEEADNFMQTTEDVLDEPTLSVLFAEAIKGPLLSSDSQVQVSTLDLIFHYLSCGDASSKQIQILVEENIVDYVFEILRLSECKDPVVYSCLKVLNLFPSTEQAFRQRLIIGFPTLIPVLRYVAEVPFHPSQTHTLKLIQNCVSVCPGIASTSNIEELALILSRMLERHGDLEIGLIPETFLLVCSIFVVLLKIPSSQVASNLAALLQESLKHAVLACLAISEKDPGLFPTEKMKWRVYLMLNSLVDVLLGNQAGQPIRDAALFLPSDPIDLLFLLGQKNFHNLDLSSCQAAVLLLLHVSCLRDDWLADERLVLASLEQYILVNSGDFLSGGIDSLTMMQVLNLYGLSRGLAKVNNQVSHSLEAERILFHILIESEWDLSSAMIHPVAVIWLFGRENQQAITFPTSKILYVRVIAELVATGNNYAAELLICLLVRLAEEGAQNHDIIAVVNLISTIINIFPAASDQLCLHGIGNAILMVVYYNSSHSSSPELLVTILLLLFNILNTAHPETLSDGESWLALSKKLTCCSTRGSGLANFPQIAKYDTTSFCNQHSLPRFVQADTFRVSNDEACRFILPAGVSSWNIISEKKET